MYYHDSAQKLSDRLALYKAHKEQPLDHTLLDDRWGAAYLYAALLQKSDFKDDVIISRDRLDELAIAYERAYGDHIDLTALFEKDWLRIVFGEVHIPYLTGRALHLYEQVCGFRDEFLFFDSLQPEQIKQIKTQEDLVSLAGGSETLVFRTLGDTKNIFWYEQNGKIELPRLDTCRTVLNNASTFDFLANLKANMDDNLLHIKKQDCDVIHQTHSNLFSQVPTIDELVVMGVLKPDDDGISFQLHMRDRNGIHRNPLHERYSAVLWQEIIADGRFANDHERLQFWYYRAVYHQGYLDVAHCFSAPMLVRFLDAAEAAVLKDDDLTTGKREYFRLISDNNHTHELSYLWEPPEPLSEFTNKQSSLYEVQLGLNLLFDDHGMDVLVRQQSRHPLAYFIVQLVKSDQLRAFNRLQAIFEQAKNKPYALWETCLMITHWRPEFLPFMAMRAHTASLAYVLLIKAELTSYLGEQVSTIRLSLIHDQGILLLGFLAADRETDNAAKARILFECLLNTTYRKFRIGRPGREEDSHIAQDLRDSAVRTPVPGTHYNGNKKITPLFIADILDDLITEMENHVPVDRYRNGMMGLPFIQLDLAGWLLEVIATVKDIGIITDTYLERVTQFFSTTYLSVINTTSVAKKDYFGDKTVKPALPSWSDHRPNDRLINWGMACLHLHQQELLDDFLKPSSLVFSASDDVYDETNRFAAQKLRTHLFVLIDAFNSLFDESRKLELKGWPVNDVLTKLEIRIKEIVVKYGVSEPAKRRFDIFGESLERWFSRQESKELLPVIASLINRFSATNRDAIIQALTESEQFIRSLKMLDRLVSEKERLRLLKIITGRPDFKTILRDMSFQDMQFVTSTLSQQDNFIAEAEEALNYTEKVSARHTYNKTENELFIFRMHLLHAYHKRDLTTIDTIAGPENGYIHGQHYKSEDEKDFYRALILMKTGRGREGYEVYDQLASRAEGDRPVIALNRFAAKLQWAVETPELAVRKQLAAEALAQWQQFDTTHSDKKGWPDIEDSISFNLLHVSEILDDHDGFDQVYAGLDMETRMRPDFLEIRVSVLLDRKMQHTAEHLLADAKLFHRLADGSYPDFIQDLENRMNTPETISYLASQYDRIYRLPPGDLIKLIPATENGGTDLPEFLLNELTGATKDMLNLINVLPSIDHEDKYSDLIMLSLNGRMRSYRWHATNTRSGFSDPEKTVLSVDTGNPGLVDFAIFNGLERLGICEAMILEGKDAIDTQKHNLKIFNYDPARRLYYLLVYFKGGSRKFTKAWTSYQDVVEDFIEFPEGYAISAKVQAISSQPNHDGIRIGYSDHGTGTRLYHLFINIDYRLELNKKTVSEDKLAKKQAEDL